MRNFLKIAVYSIFYLLDLLFFAWQKGRKNVSVLMYHSVEKSDWKYSVPPLLFEQQMEYLAKNFSVVPLADVVSYAKKGKELSGKSVAITIDDGYEDTYTTVFPVIKKLKIPITVFLTTNLGTSSKLGNLPRMNWAQVEEMGKNELVSFEVHGHTHANLTLLSANEQTLKEEVTHCADEIEKHTSKRPMTIAYASGHKNPKVIEFLKKNGFVAGFTINEGFIRPGDDLFRLNRTQVDGTMNFSLFKMRLTDAMELNRRFVDMIRKMYGR